MMKKTLSKAHRAKIAEAMRKRHAANRRAKARGVTARGVTAAPKKVKRASRPKRRRVQAAPISPRGILVSPRQLIAPLKRLEARLTGQIEAVRRQIRATRRLSV